MAAEDERRGPPDTDPIRPEPSGQVAPGPDPGSAAHIASWVDKNIPEAERERFRDMAEAELLSLHEGNFARYQIRPSEFAAWEQVWGQTATE